MYKTLANAFLEAFRAADGEAGARHCGEWLEGWSDVDKAEIAECIFRHKGVTEMWNTAPESIEQKIGESLRAREYPARRFRVSEERLS